MGRPPRHSRETLIDAAVALAAEGGPGAVTMQGLAAAADATNGSVYHRFDSRAELLASVWLEVLAGFQRDWWALAERELDPGELAMIPVRWAAAHPAAARVLLLHRVSDFLGPETPSDLQRQALELQALTRQRWMALTERVLGEVSPETLERTQFAFASVPLSALRGPVAEGAPLSPHAAQLVREAAVALIAQRRP